MILKALTLENFKGIREPVRVEFAPLILLFGPNNAGKSTIVQALMYAREVLERNNCDAGRTELGGDVVDLGGFKNLVHGHDHRNRAIRMRFDLDLRNIGIPDYTESVREHELESTVHLPGSPTLETQEFARQLADQDLWVEFEVAWSDVTAGPFVKTYRIGCRDAVYAIVDYSRERATAAISYLNVGVSPFGSKVICDMREISATDLGNQVEKLEGAPSAKAIRRDVIWRSSGWFSELLDSLLKPGSIPASKYECEVQYFGDVQVAETLPTQVCAADHYDVPPGPLPLTQTGAALPSWGQRLAIHGDAWDDPDADNKPFCWEYSYFAQQYLADILTTLIVGPGERLREALHDSVYISPFRDLPPRQYTPGHSPGAHRWANGMAAWDLLVFGPSRLLKETNQWLSESRLNTGYRIEVTNYRELDTTSPLMAALSKEEVPSYPLWDWIRSELSRLQDRTSLQVRHRVSDTVLFPRDLGVGISQVIPVIVAALHNTSGVVAIEEPESNIHPAFQVVLADLFLTQAKSNPGVLFLVETHSEHLLLRCLRRIRETAKGILPDGLPSVVPADVAVHFVEATKEGPKVKPIEIDEEGDFVDEWPGGFFEESFREKFAGR